MNWSVNKTKAFFKDNRPSYYDFCHSVTKADVRFRLSVLSICIVKAGKQFNTS